MLIITHMSAVRVAYSNVISPDSVIVASQDSARGIDFSVPCVLLIILFPPSHKTLPEYELPGLIRTSLSAYMFSMYISTSSVALFVTLRGVAG